MMGIPYLPPKYFLISIILRLVSINLSLICRREMFDSSVLTTMQLSLVFFFKIYFFRFSFVVSFRLKLIQLNFTFCSAMFLVDRKWKIYASSLEVKQF